MNSKGNFRSPSRGRSRPSVHQPFLQVTHHVLGNAGVRHPVHPPLVEGHFVRGRESPPVLNDLVLVVGKEVEDVLLQIRPGAGDGVDLSGSDHPGQDDPQLPGGHGPGQGHQHLPAGIDVGLVCRGRGQGLSCVEMKEMSFHELADGTHSPSPFRCGRCEKLDTMLPLRTRPGEPGCRREKNHPRFMRMSFDGIPPREAPRQPGEFYPSESAPHLRRYPASSSPSRSAAESPSSRRSDFHPRRPL